MTLRELRIICTANKQKLATFDEHLGGKAKKWYIERNYKNITLFKYLLFLRSNEANINKFLDEYLNNNNE